MADPTPRFMGLLGHRTHIPSLESTSGTIRFDLQQGQDLAHWYVRITKGDVDVYQSDDEADCIVSGEASVLAAVASGRMNAMAAVLRGAIQVQGKAILIGQLQRLFPGPACDDRGQLVAEDRGEA
jgi:ubiquinone biosynthesis protein UbiJ